MRVDLDDHSAGAREEADAVLGDPLCRSASLSAYAAAGNPLGILALGREHFTRIERETVKQNRGSSVISARSSRQRLGETLQGGEPGAPLTLFDPPHRPFREAGAESQFGLG